MPFAGDPPSLPVTVTLRWHDNVLARQRFARVGVWGDVFVCRRPPPSTDLLVAIFSTLPAASNTPVRGRRALFDFDEDQRAVTSPFLPDSINVPLFRLRRKCIPSRTPVYSQRRRSHSAHDALCTLSAHSAPPSPPVSQSSRHNVMNKQRSGL